MRFENDQGRASTSPNYSSFRRVNVLVSSPESLKQSDQNTAAHEFGHMMGFGDEYSNLEKDGKHLPKVGGEKATHSDDVARLVGQDAADELIIQNSDSIMANGNAVKRGHYAYFVEALNQLTEKIWRVV